MSPTEGEGDVHYAFGADLMATTFSCLQDIS